MNLNPIKGLGSAVDRIRETLYILILSEISYRFIDMKTIQMVPTSEDVSLFLISFDKKTNELVFRSTLNPPYLQTETVLIKGDMVHTALHFFHVGYLKNLIDEK